MKTLPGAARAYATLQEAPDAGRRVLACVACDRTVAWHGLEHAAIAGWRLKSWRRRVWSCPACAPKGEEAPAELAVVPWSLSIDAFFGNPRRRAEAVRFLERWIEVEPAKGMACAKAVVARSAEAVSSRGRAFWRSFAERHGIVWPVARKRRARTKANQGMTVGGACAKRL